MIYYECAKYNVLGPLANFYRIIATKFRASRPIESLVSHVYRFSEQGRNVAEHRLVSDSSVTLLPSFKIYSANERPNEIETRKMF